MQSGEQLKRLGLSTQIANDFAFETAKLVNGIQQNAKNLDTWNKYAKITDIKPNYEKFINETENYIRKIDEQIKAIG